MSTINTYSDIFRRDKLTSKFGEVDNTIYVEEVSLTAAQIIAMFTTPVEVVAGIAGKVLEFVSMTFVFDYGTVQFTGGGVVEIQEETSATVLSSTIAAGVVLAAADSINMVTPVAGARTAGKGLMITNETAVFAAGDGVARVKVAYRTHTTDL